VRFLRARDGSVGRLLSISRAPVAQGIEQDGPNVKVGGSIPSAGTN
jgi:hypothetical protein